MMTKYKVYFGLGILVAIIILVRCTRSNRMVGSVSSGTRDRATPVLPKNDKEEVAFNEKTHILTVVTSSHTLREYAANPEVEIRKDGTVKVDRHLAGFENSPFLGAGYADTGRILIGDNLLHFGRLDLSVSLGWTPDNRYPAVRGFVGIGYNVYSNTSINLGIDTSVIVTKTPVIAGFISVRL